MEKSPHPFPRPIKFGDDEQIKTYKRLEAEKEARELVRAAEKHPYFYDALRDENIVEERSFYVLSE